MPLSGHGRAGCYPVFTGCRYSLIRDRIGCKTNYDTACFVLLWNCRHMSAYKNASYMAFLSYVPQNFFHDFEKYP